MFPAYSPQAKGKIERLWQTLQSRLPVIFAQNNISSLEAANNFLLSYIPDFNKQFSVEPLDAFSAFVPVSDDFDLDRLLSVTFERNLSAASTVSLHGSLFKIEQHRFHVYQDCLMITQHQEKSLNSRCRMEAGNENAV